MFIRHFTTRSSIDQLKRDIRRLVSSLRGVTPIAMCETNRLHTKGLGTVLLRKGQTNCTTVHTYGQTPMSPECRRNLEGKILDIEEVIMNSFPEKISDLNRKDVPMIPQHMNCRHIMAPLE